MAAPLPAPALPDVVFFRDQFVPYDQAKVSVLCHGLNYGTGCFEGIRGYWNAGNSEMYLLKLEATGPSHRPGPASVVEERVWLNRKVKLKRPDEDDERDPELLLATALEQRSANAGFRPLRDFLRSLDYIHVVPQLVRQAKADDTGRFGKGLGAGLVEITR